MKKPYLTIPLLLCLSCGNAYYFTQCHSAAFGLMQQSGHLRNIDRRPDTWLLDSTNEIVFAFTLRSSSGCTTYKAQDSSCSSCKHAWKQSGFMTSDGYYNCKDAIFSIRDTSIAVIVNDQYYPPLDKNGKLHRCCEVREVTLRKKAQGNTELVVQALDTVFSINLRFTDTSVAEHSEEIKRCEICRRISFWEYLVNPFDKTKNALDSTCPE